MKTAKTGGSGRAQKVGDQIQRELSTILQRSLRDPRVRMVTLSGVEMSPDCAHATVYFTCLDAAQAPQVREGLQSATGYLRAQLARRIQLYITPQLHFVYDESVERGARLSELIDSVLPKR